MSSTCDSSRLRQQLDEKRSKWMQQRQAEIDRRHVVAELTAEQGSPMSPRNTVTCASDAHYLRGDCNTVRTEEVLDLLTERITTRLRIELKSQLEVESLARQESQTAANQNLDNYLAREIEAHTCPVCYELMVPPDHAPILLFPCGHTFCNQCITTQVEHHKKSLCPFCREKIVSRAPNFSLQQLIHNYVNRKQSQLSLADKQSTSANPQPGSKSSECDAANDPTRLQREYATKSIRYEVLMNVLADTQTDADDYKQELAVVEGGICLLKQEEMRLCERLRAAQCELHEIQARISDQQSKASYIKREQEDIVQREHMILQTTNELRQELDKLELVIAGIHELDLQSHELD